MKKGNLGLSGKIKDFLKKNLRSFFVAGVVVVVLSSVALTPNIGYSADVSLVLTQLLMRGHLCGEAPITDCEHSAPSCYCIHQVEYEGVMNVTFNPYLYPVNHFSGSPVSTVFTWRVKPWTSETSLKESIIKQALFSEFPMNIPLFYIASFVLVVALERTLRRAEDPISE